MGGGQNNKRLKTIEERRNFMAKPYVTEDQLKRAIEELKGSIPQPESGVKLYNHHFEDIYHYNFDIVNTSPTPCTLKDGYLMMYVNNSLMHANSYGFRLEYQGQNTLKLYKVSPQSVGGSSNVLKVDTIQDFDSTNYTDTVTEL
jgi:hypothetical protein